MSILDAAGLSQPEEPKVPGILSAAGLDPATDQATARVQTSADANPDQAAKSISIGDSLGVPPAAVNQDFKNFERIHGVQTNSGIVTDNPAIKGYINNHPLAASVSKDDLPQLDRVSQSIAQAAEPSIWQRMFEGAKAGAGEAPLELSAADRKNFPAFAKFWDTLHLDSYKSPVGVANALLQAPGAAVGGVAAGIGVIAERLGMSSGDSARLARDLGIWGQGLMIESGAAGSVYESMKPYIQSGKPPPVGLHPDIDAIKADQAKADVDNLQQALAQSEASKTRERSPDLYADFVRQVTDGKIGVSADAVRQLYGDKAPAPDDGVLGWVPRIQEQLTAAEATGGDVEIPIADWLAKVDPKVAQGLNDFIRTRPEGVTLSEAQVESKTGTSAVDPATAVREANALPRPMDEREVFERANAIGMTQDQYARYLRLIEKQRGEDEAYQLRKLTEAERKRQTAEWNDNAREVRSAVVEEFNSRPEFAADAALRADKVKLQTSAVPEELRPALRQFLSKDGIHPDELASAYGYQTGSELVSGLAELNEARKATGKNPEAFRRSLLDAEVNRRMEAAYGPLSENIIEAAKEQVLTGTQLDLLHEETLALGARAGAELPLPKATLQRQVREAFGQKTLGEISSDRLLADAGRAGRQAELALLKGDAVEAFRQKQRQYYATIMAREAKELEAQVERFNKLAKQFSAREIKSVDQDYSNWIHDILLRIGRSVKRSIQDLAGAIERSEHKTLEDFVAYKEGHDMRELPVAEFLMNPEFRKSFDDLSADEFRALNDSVKALAKNGRDEKKATKAGEEADLDEVRNQMIKSLRTFAEKHYDAAGGRWLGPLPPRLAKPLRTYLVLHLQLESLFNRWDRGDPKGVFTQYIVRELATAANYEAALEREFSGYLRALADKADLRERIPAGPFKNPINPEDPFPLTRKNLRAILLNAGNASNMDKLARGYKTTPEAIRAWLDQHATKEDWQWAQGIGDIFAKIKAKADVMYENLSGVAPEPVPIDPIDTPYGQQAGWYYPVIYHPVFEGASRKLMGRDPLEQDNYHRATTPAGYTKSRTGYAAPLALDLDMMPVRMRQMLHDIAFRTPVIQAGKIFYDPSIRAAITKHFGTEYREMLIPYLRDVANAANYRSDAQWVGTQVSEFLRQNIIATLIGLNPGTVLKHGPTAAINSVSEVGAMNFLRAAKGLMSINAETGETNWAFAMRNSEELQRRHRHYNETLGGAQQKVMGEESLRDQIIKFGSTPVAISDLLSAVPTWMAKYEDAMRSGEDHGTAVFEADRSVRRAHGSSVITNRPAVMRQGPMMSWLASVYGFFSHIMNRQYELVWKAGDALGMIKEGNAAEGAKQLAGATAGLFSYVIFPALIEELVTPMSNDQHESWGKKAAKGLAYTVSASWIGIRDVISAMLMGRDPATGLLTTTAKAATDFARDLSKDRPFSKQHAGNIIQHGATMIGAATGLVNAQVGRTGKFIYNYATGQEHPHGLWQWLHGLRFGTTKERKR